MLLGKLGVSLLENNLAGDDGDGEKKRWSESD